jgi:ankyrin repeat protein
MKTRSSPTLRSIRESATRGLRCCYYLAACAMVLLAALWPAGDPHPQATAMMMAAQRGNVAAMDELLRSGLDVDCRDEFGKTPLMAAASGGHLSAVRKLIAAGAWSDACCPGFGTPLMLAVQSGQHEVMHELIERGANVDAANATGQTALWYARMGDDDEAVRILTAAGGVAEGHSAAP